MKAIILAAGMGTRLGKYTQDLPKGMLNVMGKSLIERQVETLRKSGLNNIIIVKGYASSKINIPGVKYYENKEYNTTNMVATLMTAEEEMDDEILVCYSDIIYEARLIKEILNSKAEVSVLADEDWSDYWKARLDNWQSDIESLKYDKENNITEIGKTNCSLSDMQARYIGLIKFSKEGIKKLKKIYHKNKELYWDKDIPWLNSKSFKKAYMTCILQALVNDGAEVKVVTVRRGWMEFDTVEDYEKAMQWAKDNTLKRFILL